MEKYMTDKLFKVGGVSKGNHGYKVRFANDMTRVKILTKSDTDIQFLDMPRDMTKAEVVTFLKTTELYDNDTYKEAIDNADAKYNPVTTVKAKAVKPSLEAIQARVAEKAAA